MFQPAVIKVRAIGQFGFSLVEALVAVSILSLAMGVIGSAFSQVFSFQTSFQDDAVATKDLCHAGSWFAGDALNAKAAVDSNGARLVCCGRQRNLELVRQRRSRIFFHLPGNVTLSGEGLRWRGECCRSQGGSGFRRFLPLWKSFDLGLGLGVGSGAGKHRDDIPSNLPAEIRVKIMGNNRVEKGGVDTLMVIGFMVFGIALVTGSPQLTSVLSTDSRVKSDILNRQYCALGAIEYVRYLTLDSQRWADWWTAHPDGLETIYPCGDAAIQGIVIDLDRDSGATAATSDESELQGLSLWPEPAYNNRKIQPIKTVQATDESLSQDKTLFTYTIRLANRSGSDVPLNKVHDTLPPGLQYDCAGTSIVLFPDGVAQQTVAPDPDPGE